MAKYIIKKQGGRWNWGFESDKLKRSEKDDTIFDTKADMLAYLKEFKFYGAKHIALKETEACIQLILDEKIIIECVDIKQNRDDIVAELEEAEITWEDAKDNPAYEADRHDITDNDGPAGS